MTANTAVPNNFQPSQTSQNESIKDQDIDLIEFNSNNNNQKKDEEIIEEVIVDQRPPIHPPTKSSTLHRANLDEEDDDDELFSSSTSFQQSIYLDQSTIGGVGGPISQAEFQQQLESIGKKEIDETGGGEVNNYEDSDINFMIFNEDTTPALINPPSEEQQAENDENVEEKIESTKSYSVNDNIFKEEVAEMAEIAEEEQEVRKMSSSEESSLTSDASPPIPVASTATKRSHRKTFPRRRSLALKSSSDTVNTSNSENEADAKGKLFYKAF